ncbi:hypothetical protein SUGI_0768080 [Cryptomeria japonica]|nr:hypothetical protein SUGI_0768080 [Cryptomeria japonica]
MHPPRSSIEWKRKASLKEDGDHSRKPTVPQDEACETPLTSIHLECAKIRKIRDSLQRKGVFVKWGGGSRGRENFTNWCREKWGNGISINTLPNSYYLIEFPEETNQWKDLNNGPYMLDGIGVHLIKWYPNFNPRTHTLPESLTWIRLYNIPIEYWNIELLKEISKSLGSFISADDILEDRIWGSFARICVNVYQISTMPTRVKIFGEGEV